MPVALTRPVPPSIRHCELTHLQRAPIDPQLAQRQLEGYEEALRQLGCEVRRLPAAPALPDSVFVEDTAVVLDEVAVLTRPGAASRLPEGDSVADALRAERELLAIRAPGTLEGGDVLQLGRTLLVGLSTRSNAEGVRQLADLLRPLGYTVRGVPVRGCLHLKTAVTRVGEEMLLLNPAWVDPEALPRWERVEVHPQEPFAGNAVWMGGAALHAAAHPRTRERLEARGVRTLPVELGELTKAEAGPTCCSIVFRPHAARA